MSLLKSITSLNSISKKSNSNNIVNNNNKFLHNYSESSTSWCLIFQYTGKKTFLACI
ncbi:hypothetical protein DDB_G0279117 [Dictyostelium discoideum AX4]|uniref:Uncharacterized protein n=1 Tax=Dictyostelium discoideum TaxID=44689 RepID=Q54X93_DICDI|nr:hypothetical protein DDB_G0279117 [Dictyostelium discoideum AX4]EAL67897.1 hypothetical protein DDB_G0279117 [Dictyostelium discoideum AX4]|eukprot:XP_641874.1 hypothetical protein DDB_G0279117 [Dictyostelium discoideum AX4]